MMFWYGGHWVFSQAALMGLAMVVFWGLIWAVYYFVVTERHQSRRHGGDDTPKTILDQRLARGEIDADEYARLRDQMAHDGRTPVAGANRR